MNVQGQRDLFLLSEVERNATVTQRSLSTKLGVALGLTNLYLKRLARKGYVKVVAIPRNRVQYLLTPQGLAEKSRLTYRYMQHSLSYYRDMRMRIKERVGSFRGASGQRMVIYGTTELAELAYLSLREMNIDCVGFIDKNPPASFLSCQVLAPEQLARWQFDQVLIADLENEIACVEQLAQAGVPREKVLSLGSHV